MSAELKAAAVYQSLACLAGKRKGDRDTIGDAFDAEVKIDISAHVKMNGRRYSFRIKSTANCMLANDRMRKTSTRDHLQNGSLHSSCASTRYPSKTFAPTSKQTVVL